MRLLTLVDAFWPAPAPAPMSRVQSARSDSPSECSEEAHGTLSLPLTAERLGRQLRELLPLCRCLPGVERIRPLPGGLGGVGDCGLYEGPEGPGLLRIRAWRPGGRLWLSLDAPTSRLQVDLRWRPLEEGCRLDVELHRTGVASAALPLLLAAFLARLSLWLQTSPAD
jgi:hypothetical protein